MKSEENDGKIIVVLINTTYICRRNFVQAEGMMSLKKGNGYWGYENYRDFKDNITHIVRGIIADFEVVLKNTTI